MQFGPAKQSLGIVFDSDMGNDPGAALALALLNGLDGKNECRIISLTTTKSNLKSAEFLSAVVGFYASATTGFGAEARRNQAIGMNELGFSKEDTPMLNAVLSRPEYTTTVKKFNDTAEPHALIRNMLTAQQDGNAAVVLCGPATNLVRAMELQNMPAVIERKVRYLVLSSASLQADLPSARKLVAEWPSPIVVAGPEVGAALLYPAESFDRDFTWTKAHPILDAVKASKQKEFPGTCLAAALYAVRAKENYFHLSEPGTLSVSTSGSFRFTPGPEGKHRQLVLEPEQHDHILKSFTELVSAKPVPRVLRPRKADDAKKPEEKDVKPEQKDAAQEAKPKPQTLSPPI